MRISDWSSDVCSSDLLEGERTRTAHMEVQTDLPRHPDAAMNLDAVACGGVICLGRRQPRGGGGDDEVMLPFACRCMDRIGAREFDETIEFGDAVLDRLEGADRLAERLARHRIVARDLHQRLGPARSEEHTSELQSLMR